MNVRTLVWVSTMASRASAADVAAKLAGSQKVLPAPPAKVGVLLINTGTPSGFSFWPLWRYLRQFLSDRRIVEAPRLLWYPLLYLVILMTRPFKKGPAYKSIWDHGKDESPLRSISRNQAAVLQKRLDLEPETLPVKVDWAFRYGTPGVGEKVAELQAAGVDRLVVMPLFPQFSATTTASCCDEVFTALKLQRNQMAVHTVRGYFQDETYLKAIAASIRDAAHAPSKTTTNFDAVVVTYHGIPLAYQQKGDPYGRQCHETTRLLQHHTRLDHHLPFLTCFQSRLGPSEWLKPYTDELVVSLAEQGHRRIILVAPGFSSDCLETLEELELDLATEFKEHGGEELVYVPCLNDSAAGLDVIERVARKEIKGFV